MTETDFAKLMNIQPIEIETVQINMPDIQRIVDVHNRGFLHYIDIYTYIYDKPKDRLHDYIIDEIVITADHSRLIQRGRFHQYKTLLYQTVDTNELFHKLFHRMEEAFMVTRQAYDSMLRNMFTGAIRIPINEDLNIYDCIRLEMSCVTTGHVEVIGGYMKGSRDR